MLMRSSTAARRARRSGTIALLILCAALAVACSEPLLVDEAANNVAGSPANQSVSNGGGGAPSSAGAFGTNWSATTGRSVTLQDARAEQPLDGGDGDSNADAGVGGSDGDGDGGVPRLGGALKVMPLGDSITASSCYRARLAELLDQNHHGQYEFVGGEDGDIGCDYDYPTHHEGHGGYLITEHTGDVAGWAAANPADVVLLHFATNDVWNNVPVKTILAAYGSAVDELRKTNPNVITLVAKLIPLEPEGCDHCDVRPLNDAMPAWAQGKSSASSPIIVVDQYSGYDALTDSDDGVHPGASGSQKMANQWAAALEPLLASP